METITFHLTDSGEVLIPEETSKKISEWCKKTGVEFFVNVLTPAADPKPVIVEEKK